MGEFQNFWKEEFSTGPATFWMCPTSFDWLWIYFLMPWLVAGGVQDITGIGGIAW
jgi:hypothetical protein